METHSEAGVQSIHSMEIDEQIATLKLDVDRTLLRELRACTVEERLLRLMQHQRFFEEMQKAGQRLRRGK